MIIGLTGQTGAGKSTLCEFLLKHNIHTIDCDRISRDVTKDDSPILAVIEREFNGVVNGGVLDRKKLGQIVFLNKDKKRVLESILFPEIISKIKDEIKQINGDVVIDAPTLFESGLNKICDKTLAVVANEQTRLKRIILRDGISECDAKLRMNAQHSHEWFESHCDKTLFNDGDENAFLNSAKEVLLKWGIL